MANDDKNAWRQLWQDCPAEDRPELLETMKRFYNDAKEERRMTIDLIALIAFLGGLLLYYLSKKQLVWLLVSATGAGLFAGLWWITEPRFLSSSILLFQIISAGLALGSLALFYMSNKEARLWLVVAGLGAGIWIALSWAAGLFSL